MKKLKLIITGIIIVIILAVIAIYIYIPKTISKVKVKAKPKAQLTFAVLGDVHNRTDNLQRAINDLYTIDQDIDALILNGDTVDQGIESQYDSVKKTLKRNKDILPKTIIENIGNHEFFDYNIGTNSKAQVKTFINRYLGFSQEKKVYHDKWIKGYHFISLGSEDGKSKTTNSTEASISNEQLIWLKEKLAQNYTKGKPVFVFLHQNLKPFWNWQGVKQSEEINEILSKYPEVVLFTSHTHADLDKNSVLENQPFTMVHAAALQYTLIPEINSRGVITDITKKQYIKGLYIEVNGDKVIIKGRDIKEKQWIFTKAITK
ncbi:metallophosphoesterase family protein [Clostridium felsineum]|uniref:metallophosphoesterase family protein n=1 Tax=Clostridium felsineum TaxID=36839 RepID=UPI00098C807C|nr:metallophosphoesterase [Clostridium felsineum]URZ14424.1 3',5'-cyclic adenosine monophosphate phosphodiesterase CpdA [Clostridium felsineum DSM 794]